VTVPLDPSATDNWSGPRRDHIAEAPFVHLQAVSKRFGKIVALDNVTIDIEAAHVHAVLGQNGAGKTTLMNILSGLYRPDSGEIRVDGQQVQLASTRVANDLGIQMVHQHFMLFDPLSAAENMVFGEEPSSGLALLDKTQSA
jgi:simple sugar transport system ATP-binding protein